MEGLVIIVEEGGCGRARGFEKWVQSGPGGFGKWMRVGVRERYQLSK